MSVLTASVFIRSIITVFFSIAEESPLNAVSVTTCQIVLLTDGLISEETGFHFPLPGLHVTILYTGLPVTSLLLNVKG